MLYIFITCFWAIIFYMRPIPWGGPAPLSCLHPQGSGLPVGMTNSYVPLNRILKNLIMIFLNSGSSSSWLCAPALCSMSVPLSRVSNYFKTFSFDLTNLPTMITAGSWSISSLPISPVGTKGSSLLYFYISFLPFGIVTHLFPKDIPLP